MLRKLPAQPERWNRLNTYEIRENIEDSPRPLLLTPNYVGGEEEGEKASIICGPIIGYTSDVETRVIIAIDKPAVCVRMRLVPAGEFHNQFANVPDDELEALYRQWNSSPWVSAERAQPMKPITFAFHNLIPKVRYNIECTIPVIGTAMACSIRTTRSLKERFAQDAFTIGVTNGSPITNTYHSARKILSGDDFGRQIFTASKVEHAHVYSNLSWVNLQNKVLDEDIDLLIHTGNFVDTSREIPEVYGPLISQVTGNPTQTMKPTLWNYCRSLAYLARGEELDEKIMAACHNLWIHTLSEPVVRNTMGNCSNLLFINETEIGRLSLREGAIDNAVTSPPAGFKDVLIGKEAVRNTDNSSSAPAAADATPTADSSVEKPVSLSDRIASMFLLCAREWSCAINGSPLNTSASISSAYKIGALGILSIDMKIWPWICPDQSATADGGAVDLSLMTSVLNDTDGLFSDCSALAVVLQEPISPYDSLWNLVKSARNYLIREMLIWRDSRSLGEREAVILSGGGEPKAGIHDIVDLDYISPISLFARSNHASVFGIPATNSKWSEPMKPSLCNPCRPDEWLDMCFNIQPRNRLREIVIPIAGGSLELTESHGDGTAPAWNDERIRCYKYTEYSQQGYAVIDFGSDLIPFRDGSKSPLAPSRPTLRNCAMSDTIKFWSTFYLSYLVTPEGKPYNGLKPVTAKTRSVLSYEFKPGFEPHDINDQIYFPLPDDSKTWRASRPLSKKKRTQRSPQLPVTAFNDSTTPSRTMSSTFYHSLCAANPYYVSKFMKSFNLWIETVSDSEHFYEDYLKLRNAFIYIEQDTRGVGEWQETPRPQIDPPTPPPIKLRLGFSNAPQLLQHPILMETPSPIKRWHKMPTPLGFDLESQLISRLILFNKMLEKQHHEPTIERKLSKASSSESPGSLSASFSSRGSGVSSYRTKIVDNAELHRQNPHNMRSPIPVISNNPLRAWLQPRLNNNNGLTQQSANHTQQAFSVMKPSDLLYNTVAGEPLFFRSFLRTLENRQHI